MPKKSAAIQPEMTQVYQNEFMFGEGGGKGTTINSFLKSLSKTSNTSSSSPSSHHQTKRTSSSSSLSPINPIIVTNDDPKVIGASFSHLNISSTGRKSKISNRNSLNSHKNHSTSSINNTTTEINGRTSSDLKKGSSRSHNVYQSNIYMDSDDDWDATVDDSSTTKESFDYNNSTSELGLNHKQSVLSLATAPKITSQQDSILSFNDPKSLIKTEYSKIIEDPMTIFKIINGPNLMRYDENLIDTSGAKEELTASVTRYNKYKTILSNKPTINLEDLKKLSWNGIPNEIKFIVWQLLSGYLPTNNDRRISSLARKRKDYLDQITSLMNDEKDINTWHQITIDIPRTNPHIKLYSFPIIQRSLERILYLWAMRHPVSGYVQGINDICTPFFQVFLSSYLNVEKQNCIDIVDIDPTDLPQEILNVVEADTYWCLTKLLDSIQDNYVHAQPGILRQVNELKDLTARIDGALVKHLENENIEFLQFSFRWMNCLLMRELNMNLIIRMWDTYLTEGSQGFSEFHIYVCAAFLVKWSDKIKLMDFQEIMMFLQNLPTKNWDDKDIELLLSEAYMWQSLYKNASAHLR